MPLFFFNIREGGELIPDPDGSRLPDLSAARAEAVTAARSLLAAAVTIGRLPLDHAIVVTDEQGTELLAVTYGDSVGISAVAGDANNLG